MKSSRTVLDLLERTSWIVGVGLLAAYSMLRADAEVGRQSGLAAFEASRATTISDSARTAAAATPLMPDESLWSETRKQAFRDSLEHELGRPEAVLRISTLALTVPVFDGTDEISLNRGAGIIEGTSRPGESGNVGIAGHRDGFFRGLKDIAVGDWIELQTLDEALQFEVSEVLVVDPSEVSVLDPTETTTLTLVTCYPFYYVGHAPKRYIVRGVLSRGGLAELGQ